MKPLVAWLSVLLLVPAAARATVDDAHSFALEAATPWVGTGVELRQDYARGTTRTSETVRVSCQVFKGSRYWFFAGTSADGVKLSLKALAPDGSPVPGAKSSRGNHSATLHLTAPRTMMIAIELNSRATSPREFDWALVYGFQPAAPKE